MARYSSSFSIFCWSLPLSSVVPELNLREYPLVPLFIFVLVPLSSSPSVFVVHVEDWRIGDWRPGGTCSPPCVCGGGCVCVWCGGMHGKRMKGGDYWLLALLAPTTPEYSFEGFGRRYLINSSGDHAFMPSCGGVGRGATASGGVRRGGGGGGVG